jgi:low affinity Fe/Cu permease
MNTVSSIVTFLMVFLIQNAQNRDSTAIQLKLDELVRVTEARNKLVGIEHLTESEMETVRREVERLAKD